MNAYSFWLFFHVHTSMQVVKKEYSSHGHLQFSFIFSFEKDFVSLTIPEMGEVGGWKISPCYHPKVSYWLYGKKFVALFITEFWSVICLCELKLSPIDYEAAGQLLQLWKKYPQMWAASTVESEATTSLVAVWNWSDWCTWSQLFPTRFGSRYMDISNVTRMCNGINTTLSLLLWW